MSQHNNIKLPLSRRNILQFLAVGSMGAGLAACAGPGSTAPSGGQTIDAADRTGDVSFAHWRGEDREVFQKLISDFISKNPDITVEQDISQSPDYQAQALQRLRGGSVGDACAAFRGTQFENFVSSGLFTDLSDTDVMSRYETNVIGSGARDGKQYGFPYQVVFPMPLGNMDLIESAGISEIPQDWDSYMDMMDKIKSSGVIPMAFPGGHAGDSGQLFNNMIMNVAPSDDMCTKIEAGEYKCTDDWFIEMLGYYEQLRPFVQPNSGGTASEPAQQLFASKSAAMLCSGSYHLAAVRALGADFPMGLVPPITSAPGEAKYEGTYNSTFILGVNSASEDPGAALAWIEYLSDPANATTYANGTAQFSSVKGVEYDNEDLKRIQPWLTKNTLLAPRFQFIDLDMRNAVEATGVSVINGTSPQEAAEAAQKVVDERQKSA